MWIAKLKK